jgi:hypothetical protein
VAAGELTADGVPSVADRDRVELHPLHVGEELGDGAREVGRVDTGMYIGLPAEGVQVVRWLEEGRTAAEVRQLFSARWGQDLDLAGFLAGLAECGFVRAVGGRQLDEPEAPASGWRLLADLPQHRVAWLRAPAMRALYVAVWLAVPVLLLTNPRLIPAAGDAWIAPTVTLNAVLLRAVGWAAAAVHELAHLLALRAQGCSGSLSVSRRLYFLVAQTEMNSTRTLEHRRRYGPLLAGMTWDMTLLTCCLLLRLAGVDHPVVRFTAFLAAMMLLFQCAVFMRTDLYYALATWLRLGNLMQDTRRWLSNVAHRAVLRPEPHDLSDVPARDLRVARRYAVLYVGGVTLALVQLVVYGLPLLVDFVTAAAGGIAAGPLTGSFWDGVLFLTVTVLETGLLLYLFLRDRRAD